MIKRLLRIKGILSLILVMTFAITTMGAVVSDNDGSAFITKAEFESMKHDFQDEIQNYQTSLDAKIDGAVAGYLAGITIPKTWSISLLTEDIKSIKFYNYPNWVTQGYPGSTSGTKRIEWNGRGSANGFFMPSGFWGQTTFSLINYASYQTYNLYASSESTLNSIMLTIFAYNSIITSMEYLWALRTRWGIYSRHSELIINRSAMEQQYRKIIGIVTSIGKMDNILTYWLPGMALSYYNQIPLEIIEQATRLTAYVYDGMGDAYSASSANVVTFADSIGSLSNTPTRVYYSYSGRYWYSYYNSWQDDTGYWSLQFQRSPLAKDLKLLKLSRNSVSYVSVLDLNGSISNFTTYSCQMPIACSTVSYQVKTAGQNNPGDIRCALFAQPLSGYRVHCLGAGLNPFPDLDLPFSNNPGYSYALDITKHEFNESFAIQRFSKQASYVSFLYGSRRTAGTVSISNWKSILTYLPGWHSIPNLTECHNYLLAANGFSVKFYEGLPLFDAVANGIADISIKPIYHRIYAALSGSYEYRSQFWNVFESSASIGSAVVLHINEGPFSNRSGNNSTLHLADSNGQIASFAQYINVDSDQWYRFKIPVKAGQRYYVKLEMVNSDDWGVDYAMITDFVGKLQGE